MAHIEKSIEIDVPTRTAYNQWTQFEDFPHFMEGVKSVHQVDDQTLDWTAEIGGKEVRWRALITQQEPDRRIGWRSQDGAVNAGSATFDPLGPDKVRVTLRIEYEPEGIAEKTASGLGVVSARVQGDLKRFKDFVESRGRETGQWRGEIKKGVVTQSDPNRRQATGGTAESGTAADL